MSNREYEAEQKRDDIQGMDNEKMLTITKEKIEQLHIGLQDYVQELTNRRDAMLRERRNLMDRADLLEKGAQEINEFLASEWKMNELDRAKKQAQSEQKDPVEVPYTAR